MEASQAAQSPGPAAKLVFRTGPLRGQVLALEKDRVSIGRDQRNDVSIADSIISSFHAAIVKDDDGNHFLEDVGSKNGTYLNGERIEREQLRDGDVFYLCQSGAEIQFTTGEPKLPGLIESTTATYARTRSVTQALRELLPRGKTGLASLLHLTGVRRILDYELEESTRRERLRFVLLVAGFLLLSAMTLAGTVYLQLRGKGTSTTGLQGERPAPGIVTESGRYLAALVVKVDPIYGSLFLSYRENPIGEVEVRNLTEKPLRGCELSFRFDGAASGFLVEPCSVRIAEIPPAQTVQVNLMPKLSTSVLSDQTREVSATVSLTGEGGLLAEASRAIFVHGRHVFSWDRLERIAVFVDPQDPAVVEFVHSIWKYRPRTARQEFPPPNVVGALTLLTGLADIGLRYLPDSKNPISTRIDGKANDSVNFPGETLLARAGDCDDLSVLCCAVLEAAGIQTAFAVGSGHVLFLFDTGITAGGLPQGPLDPATVIVRGEKVWMPLEPTDFARPGANFASAWSAAWGRCRAIQEGTMQFVVVRDAHGLYQPMNPPPDPRTLEQIAARATKEWSESGIETSIAFGLSSLKKLFGENLASRIAEIERTEDEGPAREQAKGLLYANSGLFDEARKILERAVFGDKDPPDAERLRQMGPQLGEEVRILLSDLALCVTLGARSKADLDVAVGYTEAAVSGVPEGAHREKGELMLRLALLHRLRGDLPAERACSLKAFGQDPALRETYQNLCATDGTVAGPEDKILDYLWNNVR